VNIGMPTGSRWWVLDIDPRHGGDASLEALEGQHGPLPQTLVAGTPSGGRHFYFKEHAQAVNTAGKIAPGIDTRGRGGYVLVEGSKIDGKPYQFEDWEVMQEPIPECAEAPQWLINLAFGKPREAPKQATEGGFNEGGRNNALTKLAGRMRRAGCSRDEILAGLQALNQSRCSPPLEDDEVRQIAGSIARYETEEQEKEPPKVRQAIEHTAALQQLWRDGLPSGDKTGWPSVDKHYTVQPGQFTVLTGWPGSGKSEWLDALLINLMWQGWKFAVYSPENQPIELHLSKLIEKLSGKPFGHGPNERVSMEEVAKYNEAISYSFAFIETFYGAVTVQEVIEAATPYLTSHVDSKRGLIIDPWNELEHWRPANLTETEYVSKTLSYVRNWARKNKVHVWIVAHPQKMRREDGQLPIPRPDMIAGSQHWWNKADCAVTVYRDFDNLDSSEVDIYIQKIRFKNIGRIGKVTLKYDRVTGRYHEMPVIRGIENYYSVQ